MVNRSEIKWKLAPDVLHEISPIRKQLGEIMYNENKLAFQDHMCKYFSIGDCASKKLQISPMGFPTKEGWKSFKVRWAYPGSGKSGGFRLAVSVNCKNKLVNIVGAWLRKEEPTDAEFATVFVDPNI